VQVIETRAAWRAATDELRRSGRRVGFVPTMGALHEGHTSLVAEAHRSCEAVGMSIFVNPLQFGDPADLERYPRPLAADLERAAGAGCDLLFVPTVTEMYPDFPTMPATTVSVLGPALGFEGADRPGHFDGVATVVTLLFELTGPCRAFFGEKDFQQVAVVAKMVADLAMPIEVVGCPTIRESDGLALSSRNVRLSPAGRLAARCLSRALARGVALAEAGTPLAEAEAAMAAEVAAEPGATLFYAACVDPILLSAPRQVDVGTQVRLLIAAEVDGVRLIDNAPATIGTPR